VKECKEEGEELHRFLSVFFQGTDGADPAAAVLVIPSMMWTHAVCGMIIVTVKEFPIVNVTMTFWNAFTIEGIAIHKRAEMRILCINL